MKIQEIINNIYYNNLVRYKIIILDCCHAGNFVLDNKVRIGKENLMGYKNKGISILAACGGEETSGFYDHEKMSLFTYLLCQAFTAQYLTKKGKKSLEDIKNHLEFLIEKSLIKLDGQHPIFHTSVVGTVYFDADEYIPYKMQEIYYESDDYIVYKVEPKHGIDNKAYIVKIILKTAPLNEKIFIITSDIVKKLKYIDVYFNVFCVHARGLFYNHIYHHLPVGAYHFKNKKSIERYLPMDSYSMLNVQKTVCL